MTVPASAVQLERPRDPAHGDVATNLALALAKPLKQQPRAVAESLVKALQPLLPPGLVERIEIAGPGFINFFLKPAQLAGVLPEVLAQAAAYGRSSDGQQRPVNVEFVSANPTGPLHVGHGRQAALGDTIATLLEWTGWRVSREFYYNDAGVQIENLAASVEARMRAKLGTATEIPEGGYHGEYIGEIAESFLGEVPGAGMSTPRDDVRHYAVRALRGEQDLDLKAFGVRFDTYYLESSLYTDGKVEETVQRLIAQGATYESEGALWLRTTP